MSIVASNPTQTNYQIINYWEKKGNLVELIKKQQLLKEFVETTGFAKEGADKQVNNYLLNEGENQGTTLGRQCAAKICSLYPDLFSNETIRESLSLNPRLFRTLQCKFFGHAFSLSGQYTIEGKPLHLECFSEAFIISHLIASFSAFMRDSNSNLCMPTYWNNEDTTWVVDALRSTHFGEILTIGQMDRVVSKINKHEKNNIVSFATGNLWHITFSIYPR